MPKHKTIQELSDGGLRSESVRRRLLFVASALVFSTLVILATNQLQQWNGGWAKSVCVLLLVVANFVAIFLLFRWMSNPAKERARRRRAALLRALSVEENDRQQGSQEGDGLQQP